MIPTTDYYGASSVTRWNRLIVLALGSEEIGDVESLETYRIIRKELPSITIMHFWINLN